MSDVLTSAPRAGGDFRALCELVDMFGLDPVELISERGALVLIRLRAAGKVVAACRVTDSIDEAARRMIGDLGELMPR